MAQAFGIKDAAPVSSAHASKHMQQTNVIKNR